MRNTAIYVLEQELPYYVLNTGLLTDELGASQPSVTSYYGAFAGPLDARTLPEGVADAADQDYGQLQTVRADVSQAVSALATYDPTASPALRGELYALEGSTEILLADFFCSGVPLSTLDFQQDFTYNVSSTAQQVYGDAIVKLDSALALSGDSVRIQNLARVLKGRALLDLGQYDSAAAAVVGVPDDFQYQLAVPWVTVVSSPRNLINAVGTVSDYEGGDGLPYVTGGDPRSAVITVVESNGPLYFPAKYQAGLSGNFYSSFTVANGIEARLVRAEAALHTGDGGGYLTHLNAARTLAAPGLPLLTDPGTDTGRVTQLFRERAYDLFLTGHRQGDLRRLIRQYGFRQDQVYPTGRYPAQGTPQFYGQDVNAPIPVQEQANPLFHGCIDRDA